MRIIILTDQNYIESALVTTHSVSVFAPSKFKISLLYLNSDDRNDQQAHRLIENFREALLVSTGRSIDTIAFDSNFFSEFEKFHHNRTIFQKLLIPQIFSNDEVCICVDAGMLFGKMFSEFLGHLGNSPQYMISAFTTQSETSLNPDQLDITRHLLYPAGGILVFDVQRYLNSQFLDRSLVIYREFLSRLVYGEQDLICFTAKGSELGPLPDLHFREHIDLANFEVWDRAPHIAELFKSKKFFYMKHVGIYKPWLRWVLNPAKSIYLSYIMSMPPELQEIMADEFLISKHDTAGERHRLFAEQELRRYEVYLSCSNRDLI